MEVVPLTVPWSMMRAKATESGEERRVVDLHTKLAIPECHVGWVAGEALVQFEPFAFRARLV